jgi:Animal haem peroxidase
MAGQQDQQPPSTTATGMAAHGGALPRGLMTTSSSPISVGRFGRLFRKPPVFTAKPDSLVVLGAAMLQPIETDAKGNKTLDTQLGEVDNDENTSQLSNNQLRLPAGYTYFGQFVDHDITFDPVSSLTRQNDPDALVDFRTPKFDLDNLYGRGPQDQPYLYQDDGVKLLEGQAIGPEGQQDLQRAVNNRAIVGDPRNDENKIVSQLQSTFIRLHNRTVDWVSKNESDFATPDDVLKRSQQLVRWHYQWVVVHDFLRRIVGDDPFQPDQGVVADILESKPHVTSAGTTSVVRPRLLFYHFESKPFMPVEFSVAAYRYGHSVIRPSYHINQFLRQQHQQPQPVPGLPGVTASRIPIFTHTTGLTDSLNGFNTIVPQWGVDWNFFLPITQAPNLPQPSYRMDTQIAHPLGALPDKVVGAETLVPGFSDRVAQALPIRNLLRGLRLGLPGGEDVARAMGIAQDKRIEITPDTLKTALDEDFGITQNQVDAAAIDLRGRTPLWYYILKEAELLDAAHLGAVGGRIVAETLIGLLAGDPLSFLSVQPNWEPVFPTRDPKSNETFTLCDLIAFAISP